MFHNQDMIHPNRRDAYRSAGAGTKQILALQMLTLSLLGGVCQEDSRMDCWCSKEHVCVGCVTEPWLLIIRFKSISVFKEPMELCQYVPKACLAWSKPIQYILPSCHYRWFKRDPNWVSHNEAQDFPSLGGLSFSFPSLGGENKPSLGRCEWERR